MCCVKILLSGLLIWAMSALIGDGCSTSGRHICLEGWARNGQSCYKIFNDHQRTWSQAVRLCKSAGGCLADSTSTSESQFIGALASNCNVSVWYALDTSGCSSDLNHEYFIGNSENCPVMFVAEDVVSSDLADCSSQFYPICERRASLPTVYLNCFAIGARATAGGRGGVKQNSTCLMNHGFMETSVAHPVQCCKACSLEPGCRSFNLLETSGGMQCLLNNATIWEVKSTDYTTRQDCQYYQYTAYPKPSTA